jgi:hypothetical protein
MEVGGQSHAPADFPRLRSGILCVGWKKLRNEDDDHKFYFVQTVFGRTNNGEYVCVLYVGMHTNVNIIIVNSVL